jgi:hypothetical protein
MSRRALVVGVGLVLVATAVVAARAGLWGQGGQAGQAGAQPVPGVPLPDPTGLRLLVAGDPAPVVLDVDDGAVRRLPRVVDGVAGGNLVLSTLEPGRLIALTDLSSGVSHRLPWPSRLDDHVMGLIEGHPGAGRCARRSASS